MKRSCCRALKPPRDVTHCIFDLDGTILDTEIVYEKVIAGILKQFGKEYTLEAQTKILGRTSEDGWKVLIEDYKLPATAEDILPGYYQQCNEVIGNCPLLPGVEKLVRHLHDSNVPIAIATSCEDYTMETEIKHLPEFFSLFHHKVPGATDPEVKRGKPNPDIYLVCASRFDEKLDPSKCLVFEDAPNGVTGALKGGMQCVIIPSAMVPRKLYEHATLVLNTMEAFVPEYFGLPPYK